MEPFHTLVSRAVVLPADDVDTDQIIPARYLTTTTREGLGAHLFADWRYDATGAPRPGFPLHTPEARDARVLVVGRNFGCGSSREHAPWALADFGFRAVVAPSFADIFRANALNIGLLPVSLGTRAHHVLLATLSIAPTTMLTIDLPRRRLSLPGDDAGWEFPIDPFARHCMLQGVDPLGYLLAADADIAWHERARPTPVGTTAVVA
jgi:3-isopropylmalate/(R)-2-methylmalate dehydratase small subunit